MDRLPLPLLLVRCPKLFLPRAAAGVLAGVPLCLAGALAGALAGVFFMPGWLRAVNLFYSPMYTRLYLSLPFLYVIFIVFLFASCQSPGPSDVG